MKRFIPYLVAVGMVIEGAAGAVPPTSDDQILSYATTPYDRVESETVVLGLLNGSPVVAEFICADVCPDYTVRVTHHELEEGQTCSSVGGIEKAVTIPVAIAATDRTFCFPRVIVDNWDRYQRKLSSVPAGVGPHD